MSKPTAASKPRKPRIHNFERVIGPKCPTCGLERNNLCADVFHDWEDSSSYSGIPTARTARPPTPEEVAFERDLAIVAGDREPPKIRLEWLLALGEMHGHGHDPYTAKCLVGEPPP